MEPSLCENCVHTTYLTDLGHRLSTSEWMANTGIPLLATISGVFVAYVFLRRQLRSDRDLRLADHLQKAASDLGLAFIDAADTLLPPVQDGSQWESPDWAPANDLLRLASRFGRLLPTSSSAAEVFADRTSEAWVRIQALWTEIGYDTDWHANRCFWAFYKIQMELRSCGHALITWDGTGPEPDLPISFTSDRGSIDWIEQRYRE